MPLFTRCNIGLGCPQNVSVKFQAKIPNRSFIITAGKCHFWGGFKKKADLECIALNANELHIFPPRLQKRASRICVSLSLHCRSAAINTAGRSNVTESERTSVQPYI